MMSQLSCRSLIRLQSPALQAATDHLSQLSLGIASICHASETLNQVRTLKPTYYVQQRTVAISIVA